MQGIIQIHPSPSSRITTDSFQSQNRRLENILVIRPILLLLLVFYHAFAIFGGNWEPIDGFPEIKVYWWLDKLSYAFMLETFVFVSGYVFGYQVRKKGESKLSAKNVFWGKTKRLLIPSILFSFLYIVLFLDITQPVSKTLFDVINGVAHMWFLPMLYWCFVGMWIIERLGIKPSRAVPLLVLISLLQYNRLPLQLGFTMYYMIFFYVGYELQRFDVNITSYFTLRNVIIWVCLFVLSFVGLTIFRENIEDVFSNKSVLIQGVKFVTDNICQLTYSGIGVAMIFISVGYIQKQTNKKPAQWMIEVGKLCFGVYLLQQFILKGLYYYSLLPIKCGGYLLPWIGFVLALAVSTGVVYFIRLTKGGRAII